MALCCAYVTEGHMRSVFSNAVSIFGIFKLLMCVCLLLMCVFDSHNKCIRIVHVNNNLYLYTNYIWDILFYFL